MQPGQIHLTDWRRILLGDTPARFLVETGLRTLVIYLALMIALRLFGKRMAGQITILEMAVMIMLGAIVSVPMEIPDRGLGLGALLLSCVLLLQRGVSWLGFRKARFEKLVQGDAAPLLRDGTLLNDQLRHAALSRDQLYAALRAVGVRQLGEVARVYLEACGGFSVFRRAQPQPGLAIAPRHDAMMFARAEAVPGLVACEHCGHVASQASVHARCVRCGEHAWTAAVH